MLFYNIYYLSSIKQKIGYKSSVCVDSCAYMYGNLLIAAGKENTDL